MNRAQNMKETQNYFRDKCCFQVLRNDGRGEKKGREKGDDSLNIELFEDKVFVTRMISSIISQ